MSDFFYDLLYIFLNKLGENRLLTHIEDVLGVSHVHHYIQIFLNLKSAAELPLEFLSAPTFRYKNLELDEDLDNVHVSQNITHI